MTEEKDYTLEAYFEHGGKYVTLPHRLHDKLSNLFLVVCGAEYAVLEDAGEYIPSAVMSWEWIRPPDTTGVPGTMKLSEPIVRFATLEQAATYIDIIQK